MLEKNVLWNNFCALCSLHFWWYSNKANNQTNPSNWEGIPWPHNSSIAENWLALSCMWRKRILRMVSLWLQQFSYPRDNRVHYPLKNRSCHLSLLAGLNHSDSAVVLCHKISSTLWQLLRPKLSKMFENKHHLRSRLWIWVATQVLLVFLPLVPPGNEIHISNLQTSETINLQHSLE